MLRSPHNRKEKMNKEQMIHLIKLVKNNADNNLILLKALIELKAKVEKIEAEKEQVKESEVVDVV